MELAINILSLLNTILLIVHTLSALIFIVKKETRVSWFSVFLLPLAILCWLSLIRFYNQPFIWTIIMFSLFVLALAFHLDYKTRLKNLSLQEYCNYKIYIEIYGLILGLGGFIFLFFFPEQNLIFNLLTLYFVLRLNIFLLFKKKIYSVFYSDPVYTDTPLVSIVVIAFNEEKFIGKTLESIQAQDYKNYEVIVVDDHSADKTVELAKTFESRLPLRVAQKAERGISKSRNFGASLAKGEIILFLDSDVILPPNFISVNLNSFRSQKLSAAGFDFKPITDKSLDFLITKFYHLWLEIVQYYNPRAVGACLMVSKSLHDKVLFDESIVMSEDFDYINRASRYGKFRMLNALPLEVSWRRFQKENRFVLMCKYLYFEFYRQNIGEMRRKIAPYKFGDHN